MINQNRESVEKILEDVAMMGVGSGGGFGSSPHDITEDEEYQKFVESMVPHCHCADHLRPCDGVLAGGICDDRQEDDGINEGHEPEDCPTCRGSGQYDDATPCPDCDGDGSVPW